MTTYLVIAADGSKVVRTASELRLSDSVLEEREQHGRVAEDAAAIRAGMQPEDVFFDGQESR